MGGNRPSLDLWHTCATPLLGRGVHPKLVYHHLGHASITMTPEVVVGERFCVRANLPSAEVHSHNFRLEDLCQVSLARPSAERVDRWKRAA
jgi:hypothetical protein